MSHVKLRPMTSATTHMHEYKPLPEKAVEAALSRARDFAKSRGKSLTTQRAAVFRLLLESGRPVGAYELMNRLSEEEG